MNNSKNGNNHTPGPADIVRAFLDCQNEDTRINEAVQSAAMELDWSDTPDADREAAESGAVALMYAAPELLAALETLLHNGRGDRGAVDAARAAIAKAKGGTV